MNKIKEDISNIISDIKTLRNEGNQSEVDSIIESLKNVRDKINEKENNSQNLRAMLYDIASKL